MVGSSFQEVSSVCLSGPQKRPESGPTFCTKRIGVLRVSKEMLSSAVGFRMNGVDFDKVLVEFNKVLGEFNKVLVSLIKFWYDFTRLLKGAASHELSKPFLELFLKYTL